MEYEWDEVKRMRNHDWHGVDFEAASHFDWDEVVRWPDNRRDYNEARFVAVAPIGNRLHVMVYTLRGSNIQIISLRKANRKEVKNYVQIKNQTAVET